MMVAATVFSPSGYQLTFGITGGLAVISLILILLFSPKHVKAVDNNYRKAVGKPMDAVLYSKATGDP